MKEHLKEEFLQQFGQAIKDSNITKTEVAWSLMISNERLENMLNGNMEISPLQELEIHRFIFKTRIKKQIEENNGQPLL